MPDDAVEEPQRPPLPQAREQTELSEFLADHPPPTTTMLLGTSSILRASVEVMTRFCRSGKYRARWA